MMIGALEVNMEYVYYHLKTNSLSEKWNTAEIEDYLKNCGMSREAGKPSYVMTQPFLSVFPLNVSDYEKWSEDDYDAYETNYIAVVSTDDYCSGPVKHEQIGYVLSGLEELLLTEVLEGC